MNMQAIPQHAAIAHLDPTLYARKVKLAVASKGKRRCHRITCDWLAGRDLPTGMENVSLRIGSDRRRTTVSGNLPLLAWLQDCFKHRIARRLRLKRSRPIPPTPAHRLRKYCIRLAPVVRAFSPPMTTVI